MTQYEFRLSLRSNDPKVVFTGKYLDQFDDMRHRIFSKIVDSEFPIALCSDPRKTNQEVLLALIESVSNDLAGIAYKVNFAKASRGIDITPDMLSHFGLLSAIQYSFIGANNIVGVSSQNENEVVLASPAIPSQSLVIADLQEIAIVKKAGEEDEEYEEYEDDEDKEHKEHDEDQMTDAEYLAAIKHLIKNVPVK